MALNPARFVSLRSIQGRHKLLFWSLNSRRVFPCRCASTSSESNEDAPIVYSSSKAAKWKAVYSLGGVPEEEEAPWYQAWSVIGSIAAFLLYFCVFREPNDIDEQLDKPMHEMVPYFEAQRLITEIKEGKSKGLDVSKKVARLAELTNKYDK